MIYSEYIRLSIDALLSSCLHYEQVSLNTNTKDPKEGKISKPEEAVNLLAYMKRFLHRCGFCNTICGLFLPFWVGSCASKPILAATFQWFCDAAVMKHWSCKVCKLCDNERGIMLLLSHFFWKAEEKICKKICQYLTKVLLKRNHTKLSQKALERWKEFLVN